MAQPQTQQDQHLARLAQRTRRDVKRLATATRHAVRSLAQLEEGLRQHGITGIEVTIEDNGTEEKE